MSGLRTYKPIMLNYRQYHKKIILYMLFKQTLKQNYKATLLINRCWLKKYFLNLLYYIFKKKIVYPREKAKHLQNK